MYQWFIAVGAQMLIIILRVNWIADILQEMLLDSRYDVEDIVTVINHLSFDDVNHLVENH